jgi:hypothetical protein
VKTSNLTEETYVAKTATLLLQYSNSLGAERGLFCTAAEAEAEAAISFTSDVAVGEQTG